MPVRGSNLAVVMTISLLACAGCNKQAPPENKIDLSEHLNLPSVETKQAAPAQTVLEKTFTLKTSATFPFEIPAHTPQPHLHGIFQSYTGRAHGPSDDTANIDFVVLSEEQESEVAANRPNEAMCSVEASHNQSVNFDFPPTLGQPVKYYLVFRNPQGNKLAKVVQADFRVDF